MMPIKLLNEMIIELNNIKSYSSLQVSNNRPKLAVTSPYIETSLTRAMYFDKK
jgi:hypothetical protein